MYYRDPYRRNDYYGQNYNPNYNPFYNPYHANQYNYYPLDEGYIIVRVDEAGYSTSDILFTLVSCSNPKVNFYSLHSDVSNRTYPSPTPYVAIGRDVAVPSYLEDEEISVNLYHKDPAQGAKLEYIDTIIVDLEVENKKVRYDY